MRGKNFVVIAVDNTRLADGVPTLNTDWWNYGGFTRDVSLVDVPAKYIDDYDLHLNRDRTAIEGSVPCGRRRDRRGGDCLAARVGAQRSAQGWTQDRRAVISLSAAGSRVVDVRSIRGSTQCGCRLRATACDDEMGFRTIEVRGTDILLNGKPVFLRGISIHGEAPIRGGRANNDEDAATLLGWAKELGCNYVRLAHYPHDQRMTRTGRSTGPDGVVGDLRCTGRNNSATLRCWRRRTATAGGDSARPEQGLGRCCGRLRTRRR